MSGAGVSLKRKWPVLCGFGSHVRGAGESQVFLDMALWLPKMFLVSIRAKKKSNWAMGFIYHLDWVSR